MKIGGYLWPVKTLVAFGVLVVVIVAGAFVLLRPSSTPSTTATLPTNTVPTLPGTTTQPTLPGTTTQPTLPGTTTQPTLPGTTTQPTLPGTTTTPVVPPTTTTPTVPPPTTTSAKPTPKPPAKPVLITVVATVQVKRCASCAATPLPGDSYVFFIPIGGKGQKTTSYTASGGHVGARLKPGRYRVLVAPPYFTSQRYVVQKPYSPAADPRPTFVAGPKQV
jgi:hypothetical protein